MPYLKVPVGHNFLEDRDEKHPVRPTSKNITTVISDKVKTHVNFTPI